LKSPFDGYGAGVTPEYYEDVSVSPAAGKANNVTDGFRLAAAGRPEVLGIWLSIGPGDRVGCRSVWSR